MYISVSMGRTKKKERDKKDALPCLPFPCKKRWQKRETGGAMMLMLMMMEDGGSR